MSRSLRDLLVPVLALVGSALLAGGSFSAEPSAELPAGWRAAWEAPAPQQRPLQIVHGIRLRKPPVEGVEPIVGGSALQSAAAVTIEHYRDRGLGGLVCNVDFQEYMSSPENWETLVAAVEACHALGLVVWIYDEQGYPSGAAGGQVLEEHPEYEALELAYAADRDPAFIVRPAYEYTHASNNYYAARRYPNLIDDRAVECFIQKTHEQYWQRLERFFGNTIQATFTDEPSLIAVNIGQIPDEARNRVPVVDPPDPDVECLPRVPWCYDLPDRYRQRYGEDLLADRNRLFAGTTDEDRRVRRQFWALVADLLADRYFGGLQRWAAAHHVASSGHSLWEENLLHHVPLEGNGLQVLGRMQIPGLDMLSSNPEVVVWSGWMTAALPASAARLNGRRWVMTEVSDFSQKMGGQGPAGLDAMQATAAWQAAWGVTEFTLYYAVADRSPEDYRAYCDFVGRLNAILRDAVPWADVLLYYPIYDLWAEYLPVAERLTVESQSPAAQRLVASTLRLGQTLQRSQIPFTLIDHQYLAGAEVEPAGRLAIAGERYGALVLPDGARLPEPAAKVAESFRQAGGRVLHDAGGRDGSEVLAAVRSAQPAVRIEPRSERMVLGRFTRDGREILLLVNVGSEDYSGQLAASGGGSWLVLDPATAAVDRTAASADGRLPLVLPARQTRLYVSLDKS